MYNDDCNHRVESPHRHSSPDLSEHKQAARQLTEAEVDQMLAVEREQRLLAETLGEVFLALTSQTSREDVLNEILRQLQRIVPHSAANIMLLEQGVLRVVRWQGYASFGSEKLLANLKQPLTDFPLDAEVVQSQQPLIVADTSQDPRWVTVPDSAWIRSFVAVPLLLKDRILGLLRLDSHGVDTFSQRDVDRLRPLANAAAIALENTRLYEEARRELTERTQAEKELRQVAMKNQAMLDAIPDSMFYFSRSGQLLDYKVATNGDLPPGVVGETKIGRNVHEILPPELAELALASINQAQVSPSTIPVFEYQLDFLPKPQYFEARFIASGPDEVLMMVRNITRRKQTTQALKKSEANLRAIFDSAVQAFLLIDTEGIIQAFNSRAARGAKVIFGKEIREGSSIYEFINGEELEKFNQNFGKTLIGASVCLEKQIKVGERVSWYEVNYNPVYAECDQVIGVCLSTINIDERKKAVEALAASEARLIAEMETVLIIAQALVSEIDLNNLLEFIITQAEYLTNANGAAVLLLSEDGQYLEVATPGKSWLSIKPGARLLIQGSLAEQVLITSQVQTSNHVLDDSRVASILALLKSSKVNALLCAPLVIRQKNLGVLLIWTEQGQIFDAYDTRLMNLFASQAALALHNAHLHAYNRQLAVEQERQRLARDLHDSVTQSLYSIGLAAQASSRMLQQGMHSRLEEPIKYIHTLAQTALTEMREQLYQLHPTILNEDLVEALSRQCRMLSQQYALVINFKATVELSISHNQGDTLYYIAREALWNVVKHAKATQVEVTLAQENDQLLLSIADNGIGFNPSSLIEGETMGLRTMQERTKELDGALKLQSTPGRGTYLQVWIPLKNKAEVNLVQLSNQFHIKL